MQKVERVLKRLASESSTKKLETKLSTMKQTGIAFADDSFPFLLGAVIVPALGYGRFWPAIFERHNPTGLGKLAFCRIDIGATSGSESRMAKVIDEDRSG